MTTASDPFEAVEIGASTTVAKTVSETDVYLFAGITGDFSPNHVDEEYMAASRYGHRIAHGALLVGFMSAATAKMQLGRTASVGYDRVRFIAPVFFGDTITTEYRIASVDRAKRRVYADLSCRNQRGEVVAVATHLRAFVD
jgi:acyl dehydratase